jgi:hypothetical protein
MSQLILGLVTSFEDTSAKPATDVAVRVASRPFRDGTDQWLPRIVAGSDPEIRLAISLPWDSGRAAASYGSIDLANPDGVLDHWVDGLWDGRSGELRVGRADQPWTDWQLLTIVRMNHPQYIDGRIIRLTFRDRIKDLEAPVQTEFFEAVPNADLEGQRIPKVLGKPFNVPALLYDEVSATELYYYVADNIGDPGGGWVREGLAPLFEGVSPGQYQDWPNGFQLNNQPTLPVTCFPIGPAGKWLSLASSYFRAWTTSSGRELPEGWIGAINSSGSTRYVERLAGTDYLEVKVSNIASGWVRIGHEQVLIQGETYRLHFDAVDDPAYDNRLFVSVQVYTSPTGGTGGTIASAVMDLLTDGPLEFTVATTGVDLYLHVRFERDLSGPNLTALLRSMWVERIGDTALQLDQILSHVLIDEGPLQPDEVDIAALVSVASAVRLELAHYWQDATTFRDLLDLLCRSCNVVWWIDRLGRVTFALAPQSAELPTITFNDQNRTTKIEVVREIPANLTDSYLYRRNFRPVLESEAAATVSEATKAVSAKEFQRQARAALASRNALHPDYRTALGAEPVQTAVMFGGDVDAIQDRADAPIDEYGDRVLLWSVEGILSTEEQAALSPKTPIELVSKRLGISAGKRVEIVDIRALAMSGKVQIIARG